MDPTPPHPEAPPPHTVPGPPGPDTVVGGLAVRTAEVVGGLDGAASAYLARVRRATQRLAHRELDPADVRGALDELGEVATIDTDVPTLSRRAGVRYVKGGVKSLGGWYLRYVAQQVTAFATATVTFGEAMVVRADALDEVTSVLSARVAALEARLAEIEDPGSPGQPR